jgi:V/A-type H+-transporting ATPase subunit A
MLNLIMDICRANYHFNNYTDVMDYFKRIINIGKQMNYSEFQSAEFDKYIQQLNSLLAENQVQ